MTPGDAADIARMLESHANGEHLLRTLNFAVGGDPAQGKWGTMPYEERLRMTQETLRDALRKSLYRIKQADLRRRGLAR